MSKIYLAGKVSEDGDWRQSIVDYDFLYTLDENIGRDWERVPVHFGPFSFRNGHIWFYSGPLLSNSSIGCHGLSVHGAVGENELKIKICLAQIRDTNIVFAWIDPAKARFDNDEDIPLNYCGDPTEDVEPTCYGTLFELGYAAALNKEIVIASSGRLPSSIWFAFAGARIVTAPTPREAFERAFQPKAVSVSNEASPIERQFAEAWLRNGSPGIDLSFQYRVGPYFVDFAHVASRTAIELDGFASHSSTTDIEKDRKRQRFIEDAGWNVIRFGGREVHHDAAAVVLAVLDRIRSRKDTHENTR